MNGFQSDLLNSAQKLTWSHTSFFVILSQKMAQSSTSLLSSAFLSFVSGSASDPEVLVFTNRLGHLGTKKRKRASDDDDDDDTNTGSRTRLSASQDVVRHYIEFRTTHFGTEEVVSAFMQHVQKVLVPPIRPIECSMVQVPPFRRSRPRYGRREFALYLLKEWAAYKTLLKRFNPPHLLDMGHLTFSELGTTSAYTHIPLTELMGHHFHHLGIAPSCMVHVDVRHGRRSNTGNGKEQGDESRTDKLFAAPIARLITEVMESDYVVAMKGLRYSVFPRSVRNQLSVPLMHDLLEYKAPEMTSSSGTNNVPWDAAVLDKIHLLRILCERGARDTDWTDKYQKIMQDIRSAIDSFPPRVADMEYEMSFVVKEFVDSAVFCHARKTCRADLTADIRDAVAAQARVAQDIKVLRVLDKQLKFATQTHAAMQSCLLEMHKQCKAFHKMTKPQDTNTSIDVKYLMDLCVTLVDTRLSYHQWKFIQEQARTVHPDSDHSKWWADLESGNVIHADVWATVAEEHAKTYEHLHSLLQDNYRNASFQYERWAKEWLPVGHRVFALYNRYKQCVAHVSYQGFRDWKSLWHTCVAQHAHVPDVWITTFKEWYGKHVKMFDDGFNTHAAGILGLNKRTPFTSELSHLYVPELIQYSYLHAQVSSWPEIVATAVRTCYCVFIQKLAN
jgi:hypothetical protein